MGLLVGAACGCFGSGGGGGGASASPETRNFARYYSDSDAFCSQVVGCGVDARPSCEAGWPSFQQTLTAIERGGLGSDVLARCEEASRAFDACVARLSCSDLARYYTEDTTLCATQIQAFDSACGPLERAFDLPPAQPGPTAGFGGPGALAGDDGAAGDVGRPTCERLAQCAAAAGESLSESDLATCRDAINQAFGAALPDPQRTSQCLQSASCSAFEQDPEQTVLDCIDLDTSRVQCLSESELRVCDNRGTCRDVGCPTACSIIDAGFAGCDYSTDAGYDKCQCTL